MNDDTTQKHRLETEAKLELLFNNMAEGVALHSLVFDNTEKVINYIIEKVNPQYEKILGFNKKSIEGQLASKVYKTENAPYLKEFSTVALTGTPRSFETYFSPLNKHFSISISPWGQNGFATIFTDITEEKKARDELQLKKVVFNAAISANSIANADGTLIKVNDSFLRIWGYKNSADVLTKPIFHFFQDKNEAISFIKDLDCAGVWEGDYIARRQDNSTFIAHGLATILKDYQGKHIGYQSSVIDVTERKKAEEQIRSLLKEKELLLRELHHRVTNNVSAIGNLLMLQAESITNPEAASILTDARNRLKSMGLLHKRLYKSDKMEDCQVKDYLSQLIDEIIAVFPNRNIVRIEKDIDDFALSQKALFPLGIILNELLTNSMKHAFIDKHDALLRVNLSKADKCITLVVEDNGKGISAEKAKNSNGFGMTLVNLLADQLKGEFKIDHTKGAKFTLRFEIN